MISYHNGTALRRIDPSEDVEFLWEARNDPRVYLWCRQFAPLHWERHLEWISWQAHDPRTEMFTVTKGDRAVGCAGLTSIDYVNRRAEFSLWIHPEAHGRGFGLSALCNLLQFGFDGLGLNRVWGEAFKENPARRMFEKVGMEVEGVRRDFYYRDGVWTDAVLYSITRDGLANFTDDFDFDNYTPKGE